MTNKPCVYCKLSMDIDKNTLEGYYDSSSQSISIYTMISSYPK
jgi:hypothetical protein